MQQRTALLMGQLPSKYKDSTHRVLVPSLKST